MKLLITGGAGFIGANFVEYWIKNYPNDYIIVYDKLTYAGNLSSLSNVKKHAHFTFIHGDILDYDLLCNSLKGVDIVVHFAAESHVDRSLSGYESEMLFNHTNLDGTIVLLHASYKMGVERFHHVSTDEVYGDLGYGDAPFHEKTPYNPHNPYAISKTAAELAVKGFARSKLLKFTISNCTNNYGKYQTPEKVIPRSIFLLLRDKKIELYTDAEGKPGPNIRDWIYVEDHCRAIEKIIMDGKIGETYCIGGDCELSNLELVKRILSVMSVHIDKTLFVDNNVKLVKDRPGHDFRYAMNINKIRADLGWVPKYSFSDAFDKTVKWYLSDEGQKWLKSVETTSKAVRKDQSKKHKGKLSKRRFSHLFKEV